jgi:hypothetical protein
MRDRGGSAFYTLQPGGWRDLWNLLHAPYTIWHLSYVAIGASLAPVVSGRWLAETLLAFFLAVGVAAHALDELHGRPLRTRLTGRALWTLAAIGLGGAVALGVDGMIRVSPWLGVFIGVGAFLVLAYDLEWFGGLFHSDLWFAIGWGAFPALTGYFAQTGHTSVAVVVIACACAALSHAQRVLSTQVRRVRRRVADVEGSMTLVDGGTEPIDAAWLLRTPEAALRILALAMPLLAIALVIPKLS